MSRDRASDPTLGAWAKAAHGQLSRLQDAMVLLQRLAIAPDRQAMAPAQAQDVVELCDELSAWCDLEPAPGPLIQAESELRAAVAVLRNAAFVLRREPTGWAGGVEGWRQSLVDLIARVSRHVASFLDLIDAPRAP